MYQIVRKHVPKEWSSSLYEDKVCLPSYTEEYQQIVFEVKEALGGQHNDESFVIHRIQDIYSFGQYLLREQLLAVTFPDVDYYRVRRYISVNRCDKEQALKYNLDYRRCSYMGTSLSFSKRVTKSFDNIIFVVQVVTDTPENNLITPRNFLEYYIEYIVE